MLNICGCLVHCHPDQVADISDAINAIEGCDTHAAEQARIVVTAEDTDDKRASDLIMEMHQIPGVLTVTLTYHHFEALEAEAATAPAL